MSGQVELDFEPLDRRRALRAGERWARDAKAARVFWRMRGNVRTGEHRVVVARQGRVVVGALTYLPIGDKLWVANMASSGMLPGVGRKLLEAAGELALAGGMTLELAALDAEALGFFIHMGGSVERDERGGKTVVWRGEALARLAADKEASTPEAVEVSEGPD